MKGAGRRGLGRPVTDSVTGVLACDCAGM